MHIILLAAIALVFVLTACSTTNEPAPLPQLQSGEARNEWTSETTIGTIVAERPETARILELVGIDYCCGGQTPLGEATAAAGVDTKRLLDALRVVGRAPTSETIRDWQRANLDELMDHIVATHHAWLRRELPRLIATTETVHLVHGDQHPELEEVLATVNEINAALLPHLEDEEQRTFPAVRELAAGRKPPGAAQVLDEMHGDHDAVGASLHRLRELTRGFEVPADACAKYREMLSGLTALERDLHTHVHLENNILLPRARALLEGS